MSKDSPPEPTCPNCGQPSPNGGWCNDCHLKKVRESGYIEKDMP